MARLTPDVGDNFLLSWSHLVVQSACVDQAHLLLLLLLMRASAITIPTPYLRHESARINLSQGPIMLIFEMLIYHIT